MTRSISAVVTLALAAVASLIPAETAAAEDTVTIPDAALAACVSARLSAESLPADFTATNLAKLTKFGCSTEVADLTGLDALTGITGLSLRVTATDISPLAALTKVTYLQLTAPNLTDPSPLSSLTGIDTLTLNAPAVSSYAFARPMTNLARAYTTVSPSADLDDLAGLTKLQTLITTVSADAAADLNKLSAVTTLTLKTTAETLAGFTLPPAVTKLTVTDNDLTSLTDLPTSESTTSLALWASKVTSLDGITYLPNLTLLQVGSGSLNDVAALSAESRLVTLSLPFNNITSLPTLPSTLRQLSVNNNPITSLAVLRGLSLTKLVASNTAVTSADGVAAAVAPQATVTLASSKIVDPGSWAGLPTGTTIDLSDNMISDVAPFAAVPSGTSLRLSSNRITDVSALSGLPTGVSVNLARNQIRDFSPLPDDLSVTTDGQWIVGPDTDADTPVDLGLRLVNGATVCPDPQEGLTCTDGVATFSGVWSTIFWQAGTTFRGNLVVARVPSAPAPTLAVVTDSGWPPAVWFSFPDNWYPYPTSWTADWYRDGTLVASESPQWAYGTHQLSVADLDHEVTLCMTGKGPDGSRRACSAPLVVPHATFPALGAHISGRAQVRKWLFARTVALPAGTKATYTWYRNGHKIKGARQSFHWVSPADRGKRLSVRITVSKPGYHTVSATTAQTARVKKWSKK